MWGLAASDGVVRVQLKTASVQKVCARIDSALASGELARDETGRLRGDTQWLFSSCSGSAALFAGPLLQRCQYGDDPERDILVLQALRAMATVARPRDIPSFTRTLPLRLTV